MSGQMKSYFFSWANFNAHKILTLVIFIKLPESIFKVGEL